MIHQTIFRDKEIRIERYNESRKIINLPYLSKAQSNYLKWLQEQIVLDNKFAFQQACYEARNIK